MILISTYTMFCSNSSDLNADDNLSDMTAFSRQFVELMEVFFQLTSNIFPIDSSNYIHVYL